MSSYSVAQAKTHLSRLIDQALSGETVTITRHGKPAVEVRAAAPQGRGFMPKALLDEIIARRKERPSLGEDAAALVRRMRDGEE
jgi:prevent-host-death family protein